MKVKKQTSRIKYRCFIRPLHWVPFSGITSGEYILYLDEYTLKPVLPFRKEYYSRLPGYVCSMHFREVRDWEYNPYYQRNVRIRGSGAIVWDSGAIIRSPNAIVRVSGPIVRVSGLIVRDFSLIVRDFGPIVRDFEAIERSSNTVVRVSMPSYEVSLRMSRHVPCK